MRIKPFTMSVVVGSSACNARCPFCVSKMTVENGVGLKVRPIDMRNFRQACLLAKQSGVTTVLLTGKGEPTLFPEQITDVLNQLTLHEFPILELQTNGIPIATGQVDAETLQEWFDLGLRTIAISNVGPDYGMGQSIYTPGRDYIDLGKLVEQLHAIGFTVRMATVAVKGGVDTIGRFKLWVDWCKHFKVEQMTIRAVTKPGRNNGDQARMWVRENEPNAAGWADILLELNEMGVPLMELPHGATVYDYEGQNVAIANCLTHDVDPERLRQVIYMPDGRIRYSWEYAGAVLL